MKDGPEITYFWENNRGKTCFVKNGPGIIDFLKNAVAVMNLVENGLGMSHFWWKTADMLIVVGDGPEMTCFSKRCQDSNGPGRNLALKLVSVVRYGADLCF